MNNYAALAMTKAKRSSFKDTSASVAIIGIENEDPSLSSQLGDTFHFGNSERVPHVKGGEALKVACEYPAKGVGKCCRGEEKSSTVILLVALLPRAHIEGD